MKLISCCFILVFGLFFTSCITNKDIVYLQDKGTVNLDSLHVRELVKPYRVQVDDLLSVKVKALDQDLVKIFNPVEEVGGGGQVSPGQLYFSGFNVDLHGQIEFPVLGKIHVLGLTVQEIEDKIETALLQKYFKATSELFVTVKLPGVQYTTIGEVSPGVHTVFKDRVNVIEALAKAGDIMVTGNRRDVLIVRQYPTGQKIHHIDLTDIAAIQSPYYYIQPNDIIMVKPLKRKVLGAGQTVMQNLTSVVSVVSILTTLFLISRN